MVLKFDSVDKETARLEKKIVKQLRKEYAIAMQAINKELSAMNAKVTVMDQTEMLKYNRLESLQKNINTELAALNRGRTQQVRGYLTDVYETNYTGATASIAKVTGATFAQIERQAVYNAILTPLARVAIENNAQAVKQNIRRALTQGIVRGQGVRDISKGIQEALQSNANNALRIARTETTGVMGRSRLDGFNMAQKKGVKLQKQWLAAKDSRTREDHLEIDGEIVDIDKPFSNGLMYPGDQSTGDPAQTINCRCTMITIIKD